MSFYYDSMSRMAAQGHNEQYVFTCFFSTFMQASEKSADFQQFLDACATLRCDRVINWRKAFCDAAYEQKYVACAQIYENYRRYMERDLPGCRLSLFNDMCMLLAREQVCLFVCAFSRFFQFVSSMDFDYSGFILHSAKERRFAHVQHGIVGSLAKIRFASVAIRISSSAFARGVFRDRRHCCCAENIRSLSLAAENFEDIRDRESKRNASSSGVDSDR